MHRLRASKIAGDVAGMQDGDGIGGRSFHTHMTHLQLAASEVTPENGVPLETAAEEIRNEPIHQLTSRRQSP